jgi:Tol biopolymer transport system component
MKFRSAGVLVSTFVCALALGSSAQAAFPGANGKIAFASDRDQPNPQRFGLPSEIYTVNPDGSGETNLTQNPADDTQPAWSPDGSRIAFSSNRNGNNEIYTMNADGSGLVRLTNAGGSWPAWSPDGSKIVFVNNPGGQPGLFVMSASDGSGVSQVFSCVRYVGGQAWGGCERPRWSPNGTEIAFDVAYSIIGCESCFATYWAVELIKPDGSGLTGICGGDGPFSGCIMPDWSPDSSRLVIEDADGVSLYLVNRDGSGGVSITQSAREDAPIWSPDGQRLAFSSPVDTTLAREIVTSNLDESTRSIVSHDQARNLLPDWQPVVGPQRGDYKNAAQFCKAERSFLGDDSFAKKYGTNGSGANAYGKCVSQSK